MVWRNCQNFISLPRYTLSMLYPQRGRWGSVTIFGAQSTPDCHPGWMSLGCRNQGMAKQMRQVIKACRCCLQYEGGTPKAPLCPIVATTPLDLLHVDFTTIETAMELDKSPQVANVLVFQDHFTKYVLAYVTPDQTAKLLLNFCMEAISLSLEPQPGSWVTEVLVLPAALFRNCVRS